MSRWRRQLHRRHNRPVREFRERMQRRLGTMVAALIFVAGCTKGQAQQAAPPSSEPNPAVVQAAIAQDARAAELVQADIAMWKRGGESLFGRLVEAKHNGKAPTNPDEKAQLTQTLRFYAHAFLEHCGVILAVLLDGGSPRLSCSSMLHDGLEDLYLFVAGVGDSLVGDWYQHKAGRNAREAARRKVAANLPGLSSLYQVVQVDAKTLGRTYGENAAAGDVAYLGKRVRVKGKLESVQRNAITQAFVARLDGGRLVPSIHATMHPAESARLATLKAGSTMDLVCIGAGQAVRSPALRACRVAAVDAKDVEAVCQLEGSSQASQ